MGKDREKKIKEMRKYKACMLNEGFSTDFLPKHTLYLSASKLHFLHSTHETPGKLTLTPTASEHQYLSLPPPLSCFSPPLPPFTPFPQIIHFSPCKTEKHTHKRKNQQLTQPFPLSFSLLSSSPTLFLSQSQLQLVRLDCRCSPGHAHSSVM